MKLVGWQVAEEYLVQFLRATDRLLFPQVNCKMCTKIQTPGRHPECGVAQDGEHPGRHPHYIVHIILVTTTKVTNLPATMVRPSG